MGFLILALGIISFLLDAMTLSLLWEWFVIDTIGLMPLKFKYAMGMCLIACVVQPQPFSELTGEELNEYLFSKSICKILASLFCIAIGCLVKFAM